MGIITLLGKIVAPFKIEYCKMSLRNLIANKGDDSRRKLVIKADILTFWGIHFKLFDCSISIEVKS